MRHPPSSLPFVDTAGLQLVHEGARELLCSADVDVPRNELLLQDEHPDTLRLAVAADAEERDAGVPCNPPDDVGDCVHVRRGPASEEREGDMKVIRRDDARFGACKRRLLPGDERGNDVVG